nr:IPT/TIG domain-containing protein [Kineosporia babensis]
MDVHPTGRASIRHLGGASQMGPRELSRGGNAMRTPKFTAKRALGLTAAAALAVAGTLTIAGTSEAAATPLKLNKVTGNAAGGTQISVTGKGFQDKLGEDIAKAAVFFPGAACLAADAATGVDAAAFNVVSATKITLTTDALTGGSWTLCVFDGTTAAAASLGSGAFKTAAAPTATTISGGTGGIAKAPVKGGNTVTVTGTGFTAKTTATVDGVKATATYVDANRLSVKLPAHAPGAGFPVRVTSEYGSANTTTDTLTYVPVVSVKPAVGDGTANRVVTVTGAGFDKLTFGGAGAKVVVAFVPGGTTLTANTTDTADLFPCTGVIVESDTSLTCKTAALSGAFSVQLLNATAAGLYTSEVTPVSKTATYTAAMF